MSSERLIESLSTGLRPVKRRKLSHETLLLAALGGVELGVYLALGYARGDWRSATALPSFWWKLGCLGALTMVGLSTALRSFDPAGSPRNGLRTLGAIIAATLAIGWIIDPTAASGPITLDRLMWRHGIDCMIAMTTLSIPPAAALGLLMRGAAPTDLAGSALAVGTASATWGAFIFVFNCPHDDPLYIAVWYVIGCTIIALAGRIFLPIVARW